MKLFFLLLLPLSCISQNYTDSFYQDSKWWYSTDQKGLPVRDFYPKAKQVSFQWTLDSGNNWAITDSIYSFEKWIFPKGKYEIDCGYCTITINSNIKGKYYYKLMNIELRSDSTTAKLSFKGFKYDFIINRECMNDFIIGKKIYFDKEILISTTSKRYKPLGNVVTQKYYE